MVFMSDTVGFLRPIIDVKMGVINFTYWMQKVSDDYKNACKNTTSLVGRRGDVKRDVKSLHPTWT